MENTDKKSQLKNYPYAEDEAISVAKEVLGTIPAWYWENKEVIEKNRAQQQEWTNKCVGAIHEVLKKLHEFQ